MGVDDAGAVGFKKLGLRAIRKNEVGAEEAFLGVLLHGREGVKLDFRALVVEYVRDNRKKSLTISRSAGTWNLTEFDHPVVIAMSGPSEEALISVQDLALQRARIDRGSEDCLGCDCYIDTDEV